MEKIVSFIKINLQQLVQKKKSNKQTKRRQGRIDNVENVVSMVYRNRMENEKKQSEMALQNAICINSKQKNPKLYNLSFP